MGLIYKTQQKRYKKKWNTNRTKQKKRRQQLQNNTNKQTIHKQFEFGKIDKKNHIIIKKGVSILMLKFDGYGNVVYCL